MSEGAGAPDACARASPFEALLARLGRDGAGGAVYEALRRRLIQFHRLHLPAEADDLADVTLDRLARKIHEGTEVASVPLYALGIARMVLHEARARAARHRIAEADPTLQADEAAAADSLAKEAVLKALSACLDAAGASARTLILDYYGADGAERIRARQRLAAAHGVSLNALRNRALRLREALEDCVRSRTEREERP